MEKLLFLKGIVVGIAKIIPGFSGSVLLMSFGLYDKAIFAITHFFNDVKKHALFLLKLGLGILLGIVFFSKVVVFLLDKYYFFTNMFFIGLIFGGLPVIFKKFSCNFLNFSFSFCSFILVLLLSIGHFDFVYSVRHDGLDFIVFFIAGIMEAVGTVIPGISSTALLMLMGVYSYYLKIISNIFSFSLFCNNFFFLFPFSLGLGLGIIIISIMINYLFQYYGQKMYACILGFSFASVVLLFIRLIPYFSGIISIIWGALLFLIGCFLTSKL